MVTVSILVLFTLGFVAAALLGISSKILAVEEDPRVEAVVEVLPGANCGGCGFADAKTMPRPLFPIRMSRQGFASPEARKPASRSAILPGKSLRPWNRRYPSRRCEKIEGKVAVRFEYQGMPSCAAARPLLGSGREPISAHIPASATETASRYAPSTPCICATDSSGSIRRAVPDAASAPGHAPATFWRSFPAVPA